MAPLASTSKAPDAGTIVRIFLGALEEGDAEQAVAMVADDILYDNVGLPKVRGRAQFERAMRMVSKYDFEVRITNLAVDGDVVLTERIDMIGKGDFRPEFWVCGTFEVRDGQIVLWRDRFDFVNVSVGLVRGLVTMLVKRVGA